MRNRLGSILIAALALAPLACARSTGSSSSESNPAIENPSGACDSEGNAIVVASNAGDFYRFHPDTLDFELLAHAACTGDSASGAVWTAAIESSSNAWVQYLGTGAHPLPPLLFPVNANDGSCGAPIAYDDPNVPGGLSATTTPGILQGFAIANTMMGDEPHASVSLVTFDTNAARVSNVAAVGPFTEFQLPVDAAISQTRDGSLYAFFNTLNEPHEVLPFFATVDPESHVLTPAPGTFPHIQTPTLSTDAPDPDAELVVWGGSRFLFTGDPATRTGDYLASGSMVTRWSIDGATPEILVRGLPFLVVGTGLVSCTTGPAPR